MVARELVHVTAANTNCWHVWVQAMVLLHVTLSCVQRFLLPVSAGRGRCLPDSLPSHLLLCLFVLCLQEEDVVRLLHSLSCAKYQILTKEPAGRTISKNDKFK